MASTHGPGEREPDSNVNYAIFEQNESEESGRGYQKGIKMDRKMTRRRPNPATIIIVIQRLNIPIFPHAAAATTGAAGGTSAFGSSAGAGAGAAEVASGASPLAVAGFSRGATGAGSSIFGGFSSTLAGAADSTFLGLNNSPTREDNLRPTFTAVCLTSFLSTLFSSFCETVSFKLYDLQIYTYCLFLRFLRLLRFSSCRLSRSLGGCLRGRSPDRSMDIIKASNCVQLTIPLRERSQRGEPLRS